MRPSGRWSVPRNVAVLVLALGVVVGGTLAAVKFTTDHLLYQNATSAARNWAGLLADSVGDLEQIAAGEMPSSASMTFFEWAQKAGQVFRYEIYNRQGYSQLVSEGGVTPVNLSAFSPDAVRALETNTPVVDVREGTSSARPAFYAQAFVPAIVNGRAVAIIGAYVDQTEQRTRFYNTFLIAAASLSLLTGLAFAVPAVAWYRRTKEKQFADRRIRFLAHHDALTGLPNRSRLVEELDQAVAALPFRGGCLAVHFIDLDRFKAINDTFGHDGGDFLLKTVAERLRESMRITDIVARLGGDEFVVVQTDIRGSEDAEEFARRLTTALSQPMQFNGQEIATTTSVGIAMAPTDASDPEQLLKRADLALYACKAEGRDGTRFFKPEMDAQLQARIKLETTIRHAVADNGFELHYQPVFEMTDRHLIGFEALIRLTADDGTNIPPLVFIPVAEDLRLIDRIGAWVLRTACLAAKTWPKHLTVAVNLSPAQFAAGCVSDIVAAALKEADLEPHRLELEITESLLLGDSMAIMAELRTLKAMGVSVVMDDFGTGYSSLSYLWRFPFNKIKIDRSFMGGFDGSGRDVKTVVKTIIALGRELEMRVTVEGVETARQVAFLDEADADQVQGFYFSRPIPASEVPACILKDFRRATTEPGEQDARGRKLRLVE